MSKYGFCPICKSTVKRKAVRYGGYRSHIIPAHYFKNETCMGSAMDWVKATKGEAKYKIEIEEITDEKSPY